MTNFREICEIHPEEKVWIVHEQYKKCYKCNLVFECTHPDMFIDEIECCCAKCYEFIWQRIAFRNVPCPKTRCEKFIRKVGMYHKTNQKDAIKELLQANVYSQFEDKLKQRVIAKERINCAVKEIRLGNKNAQYIYNVLIGYPKDFNSHSTSVLYYCDRDLNTLENLFVKKAYKSALNKAILVFQILRRYNIRVDH